METEMAVSFNAEKYTQFPEFHLFSGHSLRVPCEDWHPHPQDGTEVPQLQGLQLCHRYAQQTNSG